MGVVVLIRRQGIDFFPVMTFCDVRWSLILARAGAEGYGILMRLLARIYGDEGYFAKWSEDTIVLIAQECAVPPEKVREVVATAVRGGIFDKNLFEKQSILTSEEIQSTFVNAACRRKKVSLKEEYALVPIPEPKAGKYSHKKVTSESPEQSRAEQSTAEQRIDTKQSLPFGVDPPRETLKEPPPAERKRMLCPPKLTDENRKCLRGMGFSDEMIDRALLEIRARPKPPSQEFGAVRNYYLFQHPELCERRKNEQQRSGKSPLSQGYRL